jgi:two-component system copper resistance phosphate regulon response regulator CusR
VSRAVRILLAEDDHSLRRSIARGLGEASYAVDEAADCDQTLARTAATSYDVVVLDVMLPGGDGLSVCRELRARGSHVPILMLTALDSIDDKIAGLDAGADDYLTKPFEFPELLARLRALTRRRGEVLPATITVGELTVDPSRRSAWRGEREIPLTGKEYALLEHLARNAGRIVTRAELAEHVWNEQLNPYSNLVDVYVSRLRRKVDGSETTSLLTTQRGLGYMLAEPSTPQATAASTRRAKAAPPLPPLATAGGTAGRAAARRRR